MDHPVMPKTVEINGVECDLRTNPETFQPEVFYEGSWRPIEPLRKFGDEKTFGGRDEL